MTTFAISPNTAPPVFLAQGKAIKSAAGLTCICSHLFNCLTHTSTPLMCTNSIHMISSRLPSSTV